MQKISRQIIFRNGKIVQMADNIYTDDWIQLQKFATVELVFELLWNNNRKETYTKEKALKDEVDNVEIVGK